MTEWIIDDSYNVFNTFSANCNNTCVINYPLARPTVPPVVIIIFTRGLLCLAILWKFLKYTFKNNDHYRPGLWVGRVDQYVCHIQSYNVSFLRIKKHRTKIRQLGKKLSILIRAQKCFDYESWSLSRDNATSGKIHRITAEFSSICWSTWPIHTHCHCFCTCRPSVRPTFQNLAKQNKVKTMFATGETVGLAEWIINDNCLVFVCIYFVYK